MDYFDEPDPLNRTLNQQMFDREQSESEFDEFEHHLSIYENRDNHDEMEHDGSQHQISLATSFCRNTQEPNDDFLDDKFNGDLLVENFSEDKFIRCKYSEDFFVEQQGEQVKKFGSELDSDHLPEQDRHCEDRSSEDERVIESRKKHFLEFISTIPKVCTPSVCGTMSKRSGRYDSEHHFDTNLGRLTEANEDELFVENEDDFNERSDFDWSIDQLATLKPVDISFNERKFLRFKDFESDHQTLEKLSRENDMFFSQETIAPSPQKRVSFKNIGQELIYNSRTDQAICKDSNKDSGNYTGEESKSIRDREFDFSFDQHSNRRISNIELDTEFRHQTNTPPKSGKLFNSLDFKPNSLLQTSTPCLSILRVEQTDSQQTDQDFIRRPKQIPLQERNCMKQKKRLFHENISEEQTFSSNQYSASLSSDSSTTNSDNNSSVIRRDEGIFDQSREVTFGSSTCSSMMSVCDNNSLTPKPKKLCNNLPAVKSFAARLDEIEFFGNEENKPNGNTDNCQTSISRHHNLTDSNCFVISKFNNLLNNSDSGCYLSNGSSSGSGLESRHRVFYN